MLLTSEELQPYLQKAFDHFSRDLDTPFDFVTASLVNNPIPSNFGGNILKLAVQIQKQGGHGVDGASIFKELSFMVASCIMLDSVRNRNLGPPDRILAAYLKSCNDALETFCDRHWPCEYIHSRIQGRCVNVRVGHQKGHQTKAGNLVGAGAYESNFSADLHRDFFQYCIYNNLRSLLDQFYQATTSDFSRGGGGSCSLAPGESLDLILPPPWWVSKIRQFHGVPLLPDQCARAHPALWSSALHSMCPYLWNCTRSVLRGRGVLSPAQRWAGWEV